MPLRNGRSDGAAGGKTRQAHRIYQEGLAVILDRIIEHKKAEIRHKNSRGYLSELKAKIRDAAPVMGFAVTLDATRRPDRPAIIAEVKKASPSLGLLRPEFEERFEPVKIASAYREHGAAAVSVLTDKDFFKGSFEYLAAVKQQVGLSALNKEFMVSDIQSLRGPRAWSRCYSPHRRGLGEASTDRLCRAGEGIGPRRVGRNAP
ncbi:MAG: hypothetical protein U0361_04805 [Nitrospiraceae bacterium]